ncbi:MAG: sugar isomerase [Phycisphaerae bacterium]|nr:sugar isomerase [Phycisphaerae bacterium]
MKNGHDETLGTQPGFEREKSKRRFFPLKVGPTCLFPVGRREFLGLTGAGLAAGVFGLNASSSAAIDPEGWDPKRPMLCTGRTLVVQPILMYRVAEPQRATSWKSWGSVQSDEAARTEAKNISNELATLCARAPFPVKALPVVVVKSPAEAAKVHENEYDAVIVYAASGSGELLKACFAPKKDRDTIIFTRRSSGPAYYWFEALSTRYLQTGRPEPGRGSEKAESGREEQKVRRLEGEKVSVEESKTVRPSDLLNFSPSRSDPACLDHGPVHVEDVVVDDVNELLWRLRGLYGLKNFVGTRIVALGGPWGKYSPEAPDVAREKYRFEIIDVSYEAVTPRIQAALADRERMAAAKRWAEAYLALPGTTLATTNQFFVNAFMLYGVFKDLLREHDASAFTIRNCMSTIMPISQTTPCLTLGLLGDEGLIAFCESDFVIIPAGILLHYVSGLPVFMHNSTFPHNGIVTCAHCSSPRRFDGSRYEPTRIMTHYESEYGAAPKVEIPVGQQVTFIDPEYSTGRWLGFTGIVHGNPAYEICRSQQDVEIQGDWRKLISEVRDSHWMMAYGDHLKPLAYAARKLGIRWEEL